MTEISLIGTVCHTIPLDEKDFAMLSEAQVAKELENIARALWPDVDFWDDEFTRAAEEIVAAR
jgi:hypothetical protein